MKFYADNFRVTETCNNGKERTFIKKVYSRPFFYDSHGTQRHNPQSRRLAIALGYLEDRHYYHVEYVGTSLTDLDIIEA